MQRLVRTTLGVAAGVTLLTALSALQAPVPPPAAPGTAPAAAPSTLPSTEPTPPTEPPPEADPSSSPRPDSEPPGPPRSFTLAATGDVLLHSTLWATADIDAARRGDQGFDFAPLLAGVRRHVTRADLAVCHLETPLAPPGGPFSSYPIFAVPPRIVPALVRTGYDACTTASNHVFDAGADGIARTLNALDAAGIAHAGSARRPSEARRTTLLRVNGARVALLSYTYGFNGLPYPDGRTWTANLIDERRILADAARARSTGADVVVVSLHWGDEYEATPNAQQLDLGPRLIASPDIDLLLGHHAHVVQPLERIGGEWVVYGLGNLVADHGEPDTPKAEGMLVRFRFVEHPGGWRVERVRYVPLLVTASQPLRVLDVRRALRSGDHPSLDARLRVARARIAAVVTARDFPGRFPARTPSR